MAERPNRVDPDDPVTERAVSMDPRPAAPSAGAGRAVNAAFSRHYPPAAEPEARGGPQEARIEGAGYPSEDLDDADPEDDDGYRDEEEDDDLGAEDEDDDGYRVREDGLDTRGEALEQMLTPPGGDAQGGDRDADPNLNGGHGIRMQAPEEGPIPIEVEPTDTSIIGHGHEDKAAWNRERIQHLQEIEDEERGVRDATSEDAGLGGAALAGALPGWEGGAGSSRLDQGDDAFDDELSEEEEVLGDLGIDDLPEDVARDGSIEDPDNAPFLPEHRDLPDDNLSLEERLIATPGEDVLSSGAEFGVNEELEAEDLNQTDSISRTYEDTREFMDDAMEGNERRGGVGTDE